MKKIINLLMFSFFVFAVLSVNKSDVLSAEIEITGSAKNTIKTGIVDISLEQYYMADNQLIKGIAGNTILPGETYSLIPIVLNKGTDCYVRVKMDARSIVDGAMDTESVVSLENVEGLSEKWKIAGDYLYYTSVLPHGESLQIFEGLYLPITFGEEIAGAEVYIQITAEAVQSSEFQADFDSDEPWGVIQSEKNINVDYDYEALCASSQAGIIVAYEGQSQQLVLTPEDFFSQFPAILPGETLMDEIQIKNNCEAEKELFLKINPLSKTDALLAQLHLRIDRMDANGNRVVVYDGKYTGQEIQKYVSLGTYQKNETGKIRFYIRMPSGLGNEYSLMSEDSLWTFMTKVESKQSMMEDDKETVVEKVMHSVAAKTRDDAPVNLLMILVATALFSMLGVLRFKRKQNLTKQED